MNIQPSRPVFDALAKQGNTVPVYLDLTADCETPLKLVKVSVILPAALTLLAVPREIRWNARQTY